jgi:hypothetical protein
LIVSRADNKRFDGFGNDFTGKIAHQTMNHMTRDRDWHGVSKVSTGILVKDESDGERNTTATTQAESFAFAVSRL